MWWIDQPFDLFYFFRFLLGVFLVSYAVFLTISGVINAAKVLRGPVEEKEIARSYLIYLLLTARFRPVRGELLQIGGLLVLLVLVWMLH